MILLLKFAKKKLHLPVIKLLFKKITVPLPSSNAHKNWRKKIHHLIKYILSPDTHQILTSKTVSFISNVRNSSALKNFTKDTVKCIIDTYCITGMGKEEDMLNCVLQLQIVSNYI